MLRYKIKCSNLLKKFIGSSRCTKYYVVVGYLISNEIRNPTLEHKICTKKLSQILCSLCILTIIRLESNIKDRLTHLRESLSYTTYMCLVNKHCLMSDWRWSPSTFVCLLFQTLYAGATLPSSGKCICLKTKPHSCHQ